MYDPTTGVVIHWQQPQDIPQLGEGQAEAGLIGGMADLSPDPSPGKEGARGDVAARCGACYDGSTGTGWIVVVAQGSP